MKKIGRNDPCPCGSGKKYKQCCQMKKNVPVAENLENATVPQNLQAAAAHYQAGRLPQAEAIYRKIIKVEPSHPDALHMLGVLDQQLADWHYNQGGAFHAQGKLDEAVASYQQALALKPDFANAHYNLAIVFNEQGKLDEAVASCQQVIAFKPDFAEAHSNLGNALQAQGRVDEAVASHQKALALKPNYAYWHYNLGTALQEQGKLDEVAASYRKALALKPDFADAFYNLHALLLSPEDIAPAIECVRRAVEINPSDMNYQFFLGMLLDYSGNSDAASSHFDLVEKGANLYRAKLDSWRYIKSASSKPPLITGSPVQTFKLGMIAARNDGLILEFGVRFGTTIRQIAAIAGQQQVHGFDSFEGLPEAWHHEPKGSYTTKGVLPAVPENVILHAGWFDDTLPQLLNEYSGPVRFMNIDCDLYSSTRTVLELLAERVISGTVIVFDEYIGNEHWREDEFKAFQEAVAKYGWNYEYLCFSFFTKQVVIRII